MSNFPLRNIAPLGATVELTPNIGSNDLYIGVVIDALDSNFASYLDDEYEGPARWIVLVDDPEHPASPLSVHIADLEAINVTIPAAPLTLAPDDDQPYYALDRDSVRGQATTLTEGRLWVRIYGPNEEVRAAGQVTQVQTEGALTLQLRLEPVLDEGSDDARHAAHDALPLTIDVGGADVVRVYPGKTA